MSSLEPTKTNDIELKSAYEKLYGKQLTVQQEAHIRFNLVRYIELLILLDQQHKEWLEEHKVSEINTEQ